MKLGVLERVTGAGLIFLVVLSPLPFGANRPWVWIGLAGLATLLFALQGISDALAARGGRRDLMRLLPSIIGWGLLVLWIWLQAQSWLPQAWHHPGYGLVDGPGAISIHPERTIQFGLRLLFYGMIFWLAVRLGRNAAWARMALLAVALSAAALSAYAIILALIGSDTILWFDKWVGGVSATFVNRNSFATYAGLGLLIHAALLMDRLSGVFIEEWASSKARARTFLASLGSDAGGFLIGVLLCASALLMTGSRGGILATMAALLLLSACYVSERRTRGLGCLAGGIVAVLVVLTLVTGDLVLDRLATTDVVSETRMEVFSRTFVESGAVWWKGTGAGTFLEAFRPLKDAGLGRWTWDAAHNSYLENALELGWPAMLVMLAAVLLPVLRCWRGFLVRRRRRVYVLVAVGGSALVGIHAMVDFSMQIPAIATTYALLLGVGYAQSWPTKPHEGAHPAAEPVPRSGDSLLDGQAAGDDSMVECRAAREDSQAV